MMEMLEKAAIQAGVTCLATCVYFGTEPLAVIPYIGDVKMCYVAAAMGGAASLGNDLIHQYVLDEIPINKKAEEEMAMIVGVASGALLYHYGLGLLNPKLAADTGIIANSCIGGGSELASSFVYNLIRG